SQASDTGRTRRHTPKVTVSVVSTAKAPTPNAVDVGRPRTSANENTEAPATALHGAARTALARHTRARTAWSLRSTVRNVGVVISVTLTFRRHIVYYPRAGGHGMAWDPNSP